MNEQERDCVKNLAETFEDLVPQMGKLDLEDYVKLITALMRFREICKQPVTPQGTEARVCADIAERQKMGIEKYGSTVESNPIPLRDWLQHAYEESLDKAIYLKRAIEEMDKIASL